MAHQYRLALRDGQLNVAGEVRQYSRFTAVLKWNASGTWLLDGVPAESFEGHTLDFVDGGADKVGLVVYRDNQVLLSGPLTSRERDENGPVATTGRERTARPLGALINAQGTDDTALLGTRIVYPCQPAAASFADAAHDVASGNAETVMRHYVDSQATANALGPAARAIPGLVLGAYGGYGSPASKAGRFQNLLAWLQEIATPDALRFQVRQGVLPGQREFVVTQPTDRRATVLWSLDARNLTAVQATETAASANSIVGAGGGETTQRTAAFRDDAASQSRYGRVEAFVDQRQTTDLVQIGNALDTALAGGKGSTTLTLTPLDTDTLAWGTHYDLGDRVTVVVDGVKLDAYVAQVTLDISPAGVVVTPVIQTTTAVAVNSVTGQVQRLQSAFQALAGNAEGFTIGMIQLWRRPIGEIPAGWTLLDGSDPTLPDLRDRFVLGAGGAYAVATAFGTVMASGSVLVNVGHHHAMPHDHAHNHTMGHTHSHSHGMGHTHSHSHSGAPHTHSHSHTGAAHTHNHSHSGAAHTHSHSHTGAAHTHPHGHTIPDLNLAHTHTTPTHTHTTADTALAHSHTTVAHGHSHVHTNTAHNHDLAHDHGDTGVPIGFIATNASAGSALNLPSTTHGHTTTAIGGGFVNSGSTSVTLAADATTAAPNTSSGGPTTANTSASGGAGTNSGGPVSVSTASDSTAANFGGNTTGTDASAASAGTTGPDATGADFGANTTGSDSTAASAGTTGLDATSASTATTASDATAASAGTTGTDAAIGSGTSPAPTNTANTADAGSATFDVTPPGLALAFITRTA